MELLLAIDVAVLIYCLTHMLLNAVFAKRIKLENRLNAVFNTRQDDPQEESVSFGARMLRPTVGFLINTIAVLMPKNTSALEKREEQLRQAGIRISAREYNAAILLIAACCMTVFPILANLMGRPIGTILFSSLMGLSFAIVFARFHLKRKITMRQDEIYHQLPDMMDLLSVSVAAGLGFDQALSYVVLKSEGALIQELEIAQRQIALGRARKEALGQLAERCNSLELQTFVSAVLQADEVGASMRNVLQIQAEVIRETHRQDVEEKAQKLSTKMLIPLVLFIFPVMFIILLGPAVPMIIQSLGEM